MHHTQMSIFKKKKKKITIFVLVCGLHFQTPEVCHSITEVENHWSKTLSHGPEMKLISSDTNHSFFSLVS